MAARARPSRAERTLTRSRSSRPSVGRPIRGFVRSATSSQPGRSSSARRTERNNGRSVARHSTTMRRFFGPGSNSARSTPGETIVYAPGTRSAAAAAVSALVATSASIRPSRRSRWARPGGYPSRSGETNVAMLRACASRSARYERLGSPGSKPWTTSNRPSASAIERFARTPTGTPILLRREIGTAGPTATSSASAPSRSDRRPAARSRARFDDARIVTEWPRRRSSVATPATCSLTSCGCDQANGVTRQIRKPICAECSARRRGVTDPPGELDRRGLGRRVPLVVADEGLGRFVRLVVDDLLRRRLHQVRARALERAGDPVVERELRHPHRVDHDSGGVWRVPDLELQLDVERDVTERGALHPDVCPFPVAQPRHVVGRPDMDVLRAAVVVEHRRHGVRLRDLLRLQALTLEHVEEVGVPADVELHRPVELDAAFAEQRCQHTVRDRRADLGLDVVADDRHALVLEAALLVRLMCDYGRHACYHYATGPADLHSST